MIRLAVVGAYGEGPAFTTGQAVKCRTIADWLRGELGPDAVRVINTHGWRAHPLRLMGEVLAAMCRSRAVIMMPAQNGVRVFAPLLWAMRLLTGCEVHYVVIGGWLAELLCRRPLLRRCVASFEGVYVEAHALRVSLEQLGLNNVSELPNCRAAGCVRRSAPPSRLPLTVCTYSRVTRDKGILDAIEICRRANALLGEEVFRLKIYGPVDPAFETELDAALRAAGGLASYCGVQPAGRAGEVLAECFALLFPTHYAGECHAGTLLDAFAACVPVVASDWKYNAEFVHHGKNGLLYPHRDTDCAARQLAALYRDPALYAAVARGCAESAERYCADNVLRTFARRVCAGEGGAR